MAVRKTSGSATRHSQAGPKTKAGDYVLRRDPAPRTRKEKQADLANEAAALAAINEMLADFNVRAAELKGQLDALLAKKAA
jgi:hypothetical protein